MTKKYKIFILVELALAGLAPISPLFLAWIYWFAGIPSIFQSSFAVKIYLVMTSAVFLGTYGVLSLWVVGVSILEGRILKKPKLWLFGLISGCLLALIFVIIHLSSPSVTNIVMVIWTDLVPFAVGIHLIYLLGQQTKATH